MVMRFTCSKSEKMKEELRLKLELCQDRNLDPEIRKCLRSAVFSLREAKRRDFRTIERMLEAAEELLRNLKQDHIPAAQIEAERIGRLTEELQQGIEREKSKMGILKKIFGGKKTQEEIRSELIDEQMKQGEDYISKIKIQLLRLSDQWEQCHRELNDLAQASVEMDRKNPRYRQLLVEAQDKANRMKMLEGQIRQYSSALQNNTKYQTLLENGKVTLDLKSLMPDMAKTEALMEEIVRGTENASESISDLGVILSAGNQKILGTMEQETAVESDLELFQELQQKAQMQRPSEKAGMEAQKAESDISEGKEQGEAKQYEID